MRTPRADDIILEVVIYKQQTLFLRPQGSENQILVAELQGTAGQVRNKPTSIHNHVRVVEPSHEHLRDFERDYDKYARWEIKVKRT